MSAAFLEGEQGTYRKYNFDLVLGNPPFAGDRTDSKVIGLYTLGYNEKGKLKSDTISIPSVNFRKLLCKK